MSDSGETKQPNFKTTVIPATDPIVRKSEGKSKENGKNDGQGPSAPPKRSSTSSKI